MTIFYQQQKPLIASPYLKMQQPALQDLPPTPSSSALSFLVADQKSIGMCFIFFVC